jgi:AAA+ ATPase superfamily predicted ATPase
MKFYNREKEIERLQKIKQQSLENTQFTVVTGRRRIGKTQLLLKGYENEPYLYFFVTRKSEPFLCQDFQQEISDKLGVPILGEIREFSKIFQFLMQLSQERHFTLIIDEFQEFLRINSSIFSEMQHFWDIYKDKSKINLFVCGSVYSMMHKIFEEYEAPLYGRATDFMRLKPFNVSVLKEILAENYPKCSNDDLLALYTYTGGVAKYVQLLIDNKAFTKQKMLNYMIREDSQFIADGKNMLVEEFGKDYAIYFTILSCIARGENTRGQIENTVGSEVGGYLTRMENDYGLICKNTPIFAKATTKNVHYAIEDNYLTFWFRFIYKYSQIVEIGQFEVLKQIIERDYETFSGKTLEKYFRSKMLENGTFTQMGNYWNRKGEDEIDIVAVNDLDKTLIVAEVKRQEKNINYTLLREKSKNMIQVYSEYKDYSIEYQGLSLTEM